MERLVQYLDDLEDLIYAVALKAERIREALQYFVLITALAILQFAAISIALWHPPFALAIAALLLVGMMLHTVLNYSPDVYANWSFRRGIARSRGLIISATYLGPRLPLRIMGHWRVDYT